MHVSLNNHFKLCLQKKRKRKSKSKVGFSANKHVCNVHSYPHYSTSTAIPIPWLMTYHRRAHVPSKQPPSPHTHFDTLQSCHTSCSRQEEQPEQEEKEEEERGMSPCHMMEWEPLPLPQAQIVSQNLHSSSAWLHLQAYREGFSSNRCSLLDAHFTNTCSELFCYSHTCAAYSSCFSFTTVSADLVLCSCPTLCSCTCTHMQKTSTKPCNYTYTFMYLLFTSESRHTCTLMHSLIMDTFAFCLHT